MAKRKGKSGNGEGHYIITQANLDKKGKTKPSSRLLASGLLNPEYFDPRAKQFTTFRDNALKSANKSKNNTSKNKMRTLTQAEKQRAIKSIQGKNFSLTDIAKQQKNAINAKSKNKKGVNTNNMRKTNKNAPSFAPKKAFTKPTKKSSNKKKTNKKSTKKKVVKKQSAKSALSRAWSNFRKHVLRF